MALLLLFRTSPRRPCRTGQEVDGMSLSVITKSILIIYNFQNFVTLITEYFCKIEVLIKYVCYAYLSYKNEISELEKVCLKKSCQFFYRRKV